MESIKNYFKTIGKGFFNKLFERSIRVYIQNHLGEFLNGKLSTDQVDVGLDGGSFAALYLNAEAINERLEPVNVPFVLIDGYIDILHLRIPWADISTESIVVEVEGLMLTLKLKEEEVDDGMDVKSMLESMTASMVEEMMKADIAAADIQKISEVGKEASPFESIELMSEFIQSITSRIQVNLSNIIIKTEKSPGVCAELFIESLEYYDKDFATKREKRHETKVTPVGFTTKMVEISKVTLNLEELWSSDSTSAPLDLIQQSSVAFDIAMSSPPTSGNFMSCNMTQSSSVVDETPDQHTGGRIPIISMDKTQTVSIQIKNDESLPGPEVDVSWTIESAHVLLSPHVLSLLNQALYAENSQGNSASKDVPKQTPMTHEDFELCRRVALEEEQQSKSLTGSPIDVPQLSIERHMEMMHGTASGSLLLEQDMFYSAYPGGERSHSGLDLSDSVSVSTLGANSTFSSAFGGRNSSKKNPSSRQPAGSSRSGWEDGAAHTHHVSLTIPFCSLTVLLEDPEPAGLAEGRDAGSTTTANPAPATPPPSNFSQRGGAASSVLHELNEDDDEEEIFHDSGDYFETSIPSLPGDSKCIPIHTEATASRLDKSSAGQAEQEGSLSQSTNRMQRVATDFFLALSKLDFRKPLHRLRDDIAAVLPFDHLGLLTKPIHLDFAQESRMAETRNKLKVTFGKLEVVECLFDCLSAASEFAKTALPKLPQYSMLLSFDVNGECETAAKFNPYRVFNIDSPTLSHSALVLSVDTSQSKRHQRDSPVVKISFDFGKLTTEVDITIIDRLTNLTNIDWGHPSTGGVRNGPGASVGSSAHLLVDNFGQIDEAIQDEQSSQKLNLDLFVKVEHATLRLRFPVLDLRVDRPAQASDWWRRNLQTEMMLLEMEAPEGRCLLQSDSPWQLEVQVFKVSAYMQEDINQEPIWFGEVTVDDANTTAHDGQHFNWPRLVFSVSKKLNSALETGEDSDTSATSMDAILEPDLLHREPGPFSGKRSRCPQDDLSFTKQNSTPASDEMVAPGDTTELRTFRDECLSRTCLTIDITVPSIIVSLPSRDFLEMIYNRINNDLLMWEPQQQTPRPMTYTSCAAASATSLGVLHMLQAQQGDTLATSTASDSYMSESEDEESMHYSIYDRHGSNKTKPASSAKLLNKICFTLSVGRGKLQAVAPHATNDDAHAEFMLTLKDGLLFSVAQYGGDPDLQYLCLQANSACLYHNSHMTELVQPDHLRTEEIPGHLAKRIYRSDVGASDGRQARAGWGADTPDMVTLVVKTKVDTINNVKNFLVSLRLNGATLCHEMHNTGESWISQVIDAVDLKDFPILGYTAPKIMTEIHVHIEHCCVDYRPLHLPHWLFLTVEHLSVCTNIIAESAFSQIRLSLEDVALFLTQKHAKEVNLMDYVCVAEMAQFKIWLQFCYDSSGKQKIPKSDLRFLVSGLRVRTCADSTRALLDLITYIIQDGDLMTDLDEDEVSTTVSGKEEEEDISQAESSVTVVPNITPEQEASVVMALEDAMSDCLTHQDDEGQAAREKSLELFAPDADGAMHFDISNSSGSSSAGDMDALGEDFEIVDAGFREIANIQGSHEVTFLTEDPIEIDEKFMPKPTSTYDHLRAPPRFPDPEYQYTLKELSLVWSLFGGSDFSHIGSDKDQMGYHRAGKRGAAVGSGTRPKSWRQIGGPNRQKDTLMELELNKIRFRYEVYPAHTTEASHFKLLVNNVELRDRIHASEVNKFLVKLVDKEHPEQSSAYMVMFSGTFLRPEYLPFRQECEVKAFCMPIKLNVDQVSLNFLRKFVGAVSDAEPESSGAVPGRSSSPQIAGRSSPSDLGRASPRQAGSSTPDLPIMRVGEPSAKETSMDENELLMKFEDFSNQQSFYLQSKLGESAEAGDTPADNLPVFIKSFKLVSDVTIKLDYRGKRCDMDSGVMGMMLGVASLTGSVVKLKMIHCQKGILGWDKLLMYVANEWLSDIRANQIHSILKGVGSLSILCQIIQGLTDLIWLPIEQYQKDRRIMRGLQRGANSFTLNTLMAILELTNKVVGSIQYCAELGYDMMSPGPSMRRRRRSHHQRQRHRQPRTTAEGAKAALQLVTEGVKESASNLSAMVSEESAHKGYAGVVGGTLRNATPECLFKPLALLAEAGTHIVQGARNQVDPCVMQEEEDRWKHD